MIHHVVGSKDCMTIDRWSSGSHWHSLAVQLLKLSPVMNCEAILVEESALAHVILNIRNVLKIQYSSYKDKGLKEYCEAPQLSI